MFTTHLPPQKPVDHVNLPEFMGSWYVIANIPTIFEKGAVNAVETYTWNEQKNRIDIDFRFRQDDVNGPEKAYPQKGFVYNQATGSEWRVQPLWPFQFAYLILELADDQSDTIVGVPDRSHVWIMSRTPTMKSERYQTLVQKIQTLGYDVSRLKKVPQIWDQSH